MSAHCRHMIGPGPEFYCGMRSNHLVEGSSIGTLVFHGEEDFIPIRCDAPMFKVCSFKIANDGRTIDRKGTVACQYCGKRHRPDSLNGILCREWSSFRSAYKETNAALPGKRKHFIAGTKQAIFSPDCDENIRRQLWPRIQITILRRDRFTCQECGRGHREIGHKRNGRAELEVHHIIPRSMGGTEHPANLMTLCKECHSKHTNETVSTLAEGRMVERKVRLLCLESHVIECGTMLSEEDPMDHLGHE
jgi:ribosomal protein L44E